MNKKESIGECQDQDGTMHQILDVVSTPVINGTGIAIFEIENGSFALQMTTEEEGKETSNQNMMLTAQQYVMMFMTMHASIEKFGIPMEALSLALAEISGMARVSRDE
jgi:hypothetical protein